MKKILIFLLVVCVMIGTVLGSAGGVDVQAGEFFLECEFEYEPGPESKEKIKDCEVVENENGEKYWYRILSDGTVEIADYKEANGITKILVPSMIDGRKVTRIGDCAFEQCTKLTSIKLPNGLTSIGEEAFYYCVRLMNVEIPNSVTNIEGWTFFDCTNLRSIKLPDKVTSIEDGMFCMCLQLSSIEIPDGVTNIGDLAFQECILTSIEIPDGVTSIGEAAFFGNDYLTSVEIPDGVTSIGEAAFCYCDCLESIKLPASLKTIGKAAFDECSLLKNVYYNGSKTQWKTMKIGSSNDKLLNASIHYNLSESQNPNDNNTNNNILNNGNINKNNRDNQDDNGEQYDVKDDNERDEKEQRDNNTDDKNIDNNKNESKTLQTINLSKTSYIYTGKAHTPNITVTDGKGRTVNASNYTVTYAKNKNVGQATVTVRGKGNYTGTVTATFTIRPKGTSLTKVAAKKKAIVVKWKKQTKQITGYEIQYSTKKSFKGAKTKIIKKRKSSVTVKKLKARKKYYVRIRTYKTVKIDGKSKKIYSKWSKAKRVKTKK